MFKAFCNLCDGKLDRNNKGAAFRFENLRTLRTAQMIGLEISVFITGEPNDETHICGLCLSELMAKAMNSSSEVRERLKLIEIKEKDLDRLELSLELAEKKLRSESKAVNSVKNDVINKEATLLNTLKERDEKIKVLEAKLQAVHVDLNTAIQQRRIVKPVFDKAV